MMIRNDDIVLKEEEDDLSCVSLKILRAFALYTVLLKESTLLAFE